MSQYSESFAIERFGAFWLDSVYSVELPEDAEPAEAEAGHGRERGGAEAADDPERQDRGPAGRQFAKGLPMPVHGAGCSVSG